MQHDHELGVLLPEFKILHTLFSFPTDALDERRPLLRVAGQQLFVLHILLMDNGVCEVLLVAGAVLFAHLERVEDMNFRPRHVELVGQRRDKIGIELIFAALLRQIGPRPAEYP